MSRVSASKVLHRSMWTQSNCNHSAAGAMAYECCAVSEWQASDIEQSFRGLSLIAVEIVGKPQEWVKTTVRRSRAAPPTHDDDHVYVRCPLPKGVARVRGFICLERLLFLWHVVRLSNMSCLDRCPCMRSLVEPATTGPQTACTWGE